MKGLLITVEGIDGSGKSTLAHSLAEKLLTAGHDCILTKEPGQTALGQKLSASLQQNKAVVGDMAEFLLFAANRAQHFEEVIIPGLRAGKIIISDRMADSSLAYQGYGRGLDLAMIKKINAWVMRAITPDLTFYLAIDVPSAHERIRQRKQILTSFEQEQIDFWQRVHDGYETIFVGRSNVVRLDATKSPAALAGEAVADVLPLRLP